MYIHSITYVHDTSITHGEQHSPYLPQPSWWCTVLYAIVQPSDDSNTGTGCGQAVSHGLQRLLHCRPPEARQACWQRIRVLLDMPTCPHHLEEVFNFCEEIGRHCTNWHSTNLMDTWLRVPWTVYFIYCEFNWTIPCLALYVYVHNIFFLSYPEYDHAVLWYIGAWFIPHPFCFHVLSCIPPDSLSTLDYEFHML